MLDEGGLYGATSVGRLEDTVPVIGGRSFGIALRDCDPGLHRSELCVHDFL